ncbi:MAG: T9SS type A sorting domain-containing protein, partial [Candidatus Symbiothrix sp.]|nr:T9SS type A sorting domain-containing protein [Candidatus Symbiothrix sp.]
NYVADRNISVKAILNGNLIDDAVALKLDATQPATTEANIVLANKPFSIEAWFQRTPGQAGTLFAHGNDFSLGFDANNKVVVKFGKETFTSVSALDNVNWQYIGFAYDNEQRAFDVYSLTGHETKNIFIAKKVAAPYSGNGKLYVGAKADNSNAFTGAVHDITLWNATRIIADASADKNTVKTGTERNLIGYWQLNEGHGKVAQDKARSRHLSLPNENYWYLQNVNKAVSFNGTSNHLLINTTNIPVSSDESYLVEFWFKGQTQANATLFSCGDGVIESNASNKLSIGFDANRKLILKAKGGSYSLSNADFLDNSWHHLALNSIRNGSTIVYVDGTAIKQLSGTAVGGLQGATIALGARRYTLDNVSYTTNNFFKGSIDEVRIWKASVTADVIRRNIYNRLSGNENGLIAYYPFEKTFINAYSQQVTEGTLEDRVIENPETGLAPAAPATGSSTFTDQSPALKEARTLENVAHTWTASNNKVVINIVEPAYRIENSTLEMTVSGILDLNNNPVAQPIAWSAYVNMNRLNWSDSELIISKEYLDEKTVEVFISNESGKEENWTISNVPSWLTVSKLYGSLKPLSNEKLTFKVKSSTPVGSYEDILYLTGSNQIDAPLGLSLKVSSPKPDWSVNPANFESSMNLIAQLHFEGAVSEDAEDLVAAFVNDTCIGVASPVYYSNYDAYYIITNIYGNDDWDGRKVTFKAWDASTGEIYPVVSTGATDVVFVANKLYGSIAVPVILNAENKVEQQMQLSKGWNWLSLNIRPDDLSVGNVFQSVRSNTVLLKSKTGIGVVENNKWVVGSDLTAIEIAKMYKLNVNASVPFRLIGNKVNPLETLVSIRKNWNWIGYTPQFSLSTQDALADLEAVEGDLIKGQSQFAIYAGNAWIGPLQTLAPGKGYLYQSQANSDKQFHYPSVSSALRSAQYIAVPSYWIPVDENAYPGSMSIIAVVKNGNEIVSDVEVGVFAGDECRGAQATLDNGLLLLSVAGDDNQIPLTFKVYEPSSDAVSNPVQTLTFREDAIYGSASEPYVIQLSPAGLTQLTANNLRIYPTQVKNVLHVDSDDHTLRAIRIYDVSGSIVRGIDNASSANTINVSALSQGVYIVAVETTGGERFTALIFK